MSVDLPPLYRIAPVRDQPEPQLGISERLQRGGEIRDGDAGLWKMGLEVLEQSRGCTTGQTELRLDLTVEVSARTIAVVIDDHHAIDIASAYRREQVTQSHELRFQVAAKRLTAIQKGSVQVEKNGLQPHVLERYRVFRQLVRTAWGRSGLATAVAPPTHGVAAPGFGQQTLCPHQMRRTSAESM
jgi:hypothetical protein